MAADRLSGLLPIRAAGGILSRDVYRDSLLTQTGVDGKVVMRKIMIIHGPNLNLLGQREPEIYGTTTLEQIDARLTQLAKEFGAEARTFQSNSEGEIVTAIQESAGWADALIINAGAYTHTSLAIPDAIQGVRMPAIEVHLSNIFTRETFRQQSYLSRVCIGIISGFGAESYLLALRALMAM